jgi:hypothetical protein
LLIEGGPKTRGSGSAFGSATLLIILHKREKTERRLSPTRLTVLSGTLSLSKTTSSWAPGRAFSWKTIKLGTSVPFPRLDSSPIVRPSNNLQGEDGQKHYDDRVIKTFWFRFKHR